MVYETDFYTTRRPYSRPNISSYSVTTPLRFIPGVARYYNWSPYSPYLYHHYIPHYSSAYHYPGSLYLPSAVPLRYYTRSTPTRVFSSYLDDYTPPRIFSVHVRPSVIHRELLRIEHKPRIRYGSEPLAEYLNSPSVKNFEDEVSNIRTHAARVLARCHTPLPRNRRAISCAPFARYGYDPIERDFLDNLRAKSLAPVDDLFALTKYQDPPRRYTGMFDEYIYNPGHYLQKLRDILELRKEERLKNVWQRKEYSQNRASSVIRASSVRPMTALCY